MNTPSPTTVVLILLFIPCVICCYWNKNEAAQSIAAKLIGV